MEICASLFLVFTDCPVLNNPNNGAVSADNRTANYTCETGYVINGTDDTQLTATCQSNGAWSPESASCVKRGLLECLATV